MKNEFKTQLHYTVLLKIIKDSHQMFYLFHAYFIVVHRKIPLRPLSVNHMHITKIKLFFLSVSFSYCISLTEIGTPMLYTYTFISNSSAEEWKIQMFATFFA